MRIVPKKVLDEIVTSSDIGITFPVVGTVGVSDYTSPEVEPEGGSGDGDGSKIRHRDYRDDRAVNFYSRSIKKAMKISAPSHAHLAVVYSVVRSKRRTGRGRVFYSPYIKKDDKGNSYFYVWITVHDQTFTPEMFRKYVSPEVTIEYVSPSEIAPNVLNGDDSW